MYYTIPIGKRYLDIEHKIHLAMFLKQLGIIDVFYAYETPYNKSYNVMMTFERRSFV